MPQSAEEVLKRMAGAQGEHESLELAPGVMVALHEPQGQDLLQALALAAGNDSLVPMFEAMLCVASVNGQPQARLTSRAVADALAKQLTRRGLMALSNWYAHKVNPELAQAIEECGPGAAMEEIQRRAAEIASAGAKK